MTAFTLVRLELTFNLCISKRERKRVRERKIVGCPLSQGLDRLCQVLLESKIICVNDNNLTDTIANWEFGVY